MFDGYDALTKDSTRQKRSGKMLQVVEISDTNPCPSDRDLFLANYTNKQTFVSALAAKLELSGVNAILCSSDADTTIVKTALKIDDISALVLTDDTDNICLMMHHVHVSDKSYDIFIKNMTRKKASDQRVCYRIQDVLDESDTVIAEFILFAHAFTGCDTTSAIHNFGKQSIFTKLRSSASLREIARQFYVYNVSPQEIGQSAIRFFETLHSPTCSLKQIRKQKYNRMVLSDRAKIDPDLLPPSQEQPTTMVSEFTTRSKCGSN